MKVKSVQIASTLMLALMLVLPACGKSDTPAQPENKTDSQTNNADSGKSEGDSTKSNKEDTSSITFTFFGADPNPNWNNMQDDVGKAITAKTGVTVKAEFEVGGASGQKVALIAASGEYPDLIFAKSDINKMVDAGAMLDLTDLIDKYAPNIKKVVGKYEKRLRYSDEDHAIYVIPSNAAVDGTSFDAGGGFELQHAVVQELGYPKMRTVQDFENAIKAYKEKHPTIDGQPTIGLTLNADDWRMLISVTNPAFYTTGGPDDGEFYIDQNTQKVTYHFRRPEEKEYFRWLNHMNDIGLLDKESFVQKYDQYKAKIATGRVLGLIDQSWDYGDGERALKAAGKYDRGYGHYPITLSEEYKEHSFQSTGFLSGYGVGITKSCKDPVRAIKFLDFLASDEGQILNNWGIEGKHYKMENGKRVVPKEVNDRKINDAINFSKEAGIGFYFLSAHYGDGVKDPTGNYYTTNFPEQIAASYNDVEKDVLSHYNATTWKDLFPKEDEFPVKPWGAAWTISVPSDSEVSVLSNKMKDITWKRVPESIMAKPDKFDAIWDAYQKELIDAGVEKLEQGYETYVKARIKLWNE
ncbi:ABC transporter substrate-binding protein [Paenibacillus guangzhouensis]|uniref:ABC transporter substrate-binding protein n=1 Tax=Paenibacillus guangzhouensis TaxID=1473112 RepID=UPI0012668C64|nr:ABC transporter substrate-binding protein [Paenibacillus guangzhouensis]